MKHLDDTNVRPESSIPSDSPKDGEMNMSRRQFLKAGLTGGLMIAIGGVWMSLDDAMAKAKSEYAMVIDLNKCVGCRACEVACNQRNELPEGLSYIRVFQDWEGSEAHPIPDKKREYERVHLPVQCQHCEEPPCEPVCPVGATYHDPHGVVLVNEKTCVGCRYCAVACPYDARRLNEETGIMEKCWLCLDWVLGGGMPACVQACVLGARIFGRRDDPDSEVAKLIDSGRAKPLHPEYGTVPGIIHYIFPGE